MNAAPADTSNRTAASAPRGGRAGSALTKGGAVVAVAAARLPERRSDEERKHLEFSREVRQHLELSVSAKGGGASPLPPFRSLRWLP
jgi:hypothetical protein